MSAWGLPLGLGKLAHMLEVTTVDAVGASGLSADQIFAPIEHEPKLARRGLRRRSSVT